MGGDIGEHRVAQQTAAGERAVGGEDQTALPARLHQLGLVEMGVVLGLQGDQRFRTKPDRFIEQRDIEIRDADMAREPLPLGLGQRADRLVECNLRVRPVHEQEVDEIDAQILEALIDRTREVIGAQIFVRHLGGQENLVAPQAGRADPLADAALGAVFPGGVDVAIAELQRGGDDLAAIAERRRAESDRRYLGAMRGQSGDGVWGHRWDREGGGGGEASERPGSAGGR